MFSPYWQANPYLSWGLLLGLIAVASCDQPPPTTPPPLSVTATGNLSKIATSAVDADRQLMRTIVVAATRDGIDNADQWFGPKHRNPQSVCRGLERLIAKHLVTFEQAKHIARTPTARAAKAAEIVRSTRCGQPTPMMAFGSAMALRAASPLPMPDETDDWFAANWHEDFWNQRVTAWADNGIIFIEPYTSGMTDYEISQFQATQCAAMDAMNDIAYSEGESLTMMMYFLPGWAKAALGGCAANVVTSIPEIIGGARAGFVVLGGPGGAVLSATAIVAETCAYGAVAGYIGYTIGGW